MAYVYRYTDLKDNIIKYVGIVYGCSSNLRKRINEHKRLDDWVSKSNFKIEYQDFDVNSRTDAEVLEGHYIALYKTYKYYNKSKKGWGLCSFLPNREHLWKPYKEEQYNKCNDCNVKQKYKMLENHYDKLKQDTAYALIQITKKYKEEKQKNECIIDSLLGFKTLYEYVRGKINICRKQEKIDLYFDILSHIEHTYNSTLDFHKPDITIDFGAFIDQYESMRGNNI